MEQGTDAKIYGRTQQVQDVIVAGLSGINDCALVTDAHLAAITTLNLSGQGMTALRADDFAGLTHLQELRLSGNALTTLPTGVFSGLTTLQCLFLDHTLLTTLPGSLLDDLEARSVAVDLKENPGYLGPGPFDFRRRSDGSPLVTDVATTRGSNSINGLPRAKGRLVQTFKFLKALTEL